MRFRYDLNMIIMKIGKSIRQHLELYSLAAVAVGLSAGKISQGTLLKYLIPFALFMMLYPAFLETDIGVIIKNSFVGKKLLITALFVNFAISPLLMYGLMQLFSAGLIPDVMLGLLIFSLIPGGGMGPAYTGMISGNVSLSIAITAVGLAMSIIFMPLWSVLLLGKAVHVPAAVIVKYLFMIIIMPAALAAISRRWITQTHGSVVFERIKGQFQNVTGIGLLLLIFIIFDLNGRFVMENYSLIANILFPAVCFSMMLLAIASIIAAICRSDYGDSVAFIISVTLKNTAVSMALATTVFQDMTALTIAITGPLVQFPVMLSYLKFRVAPPV
ncbi:MAG: Sodium Bile acid symporter family protein [Syntrophus sp. PtaB.Bin001]|nr:MAG: Sodium Bile acid symporter family protein [Syntrophus sp. PtaB.Bin001]